MKKISIILLSLFLFGCMSKSPKNEYIEGISLTVGVWIPLNGQIYGLQALSFISGKKISMTTNQNMKVDSSQTISNGLSNISFNSTNVTNIK